MEKKSYECPKMETFFFVTKENLAANPVPGLDNSGLYRSDEWDSNVNGN